MNTKELIEEADALEKRARVLRVLADTQKLEQELAVAREALRQIAIALGLPPDAKGGAIVESVRSFVRDFGEAVKCATG